MLCSYKGLSLQFYNLSFLGLSFLRLKIKGWDQVISSVLFSGSKILCFYKAKQPRATKTVWLNRTFLCDDVWHTRILTVPIVTASWVYKGAWTPNVCILILRIKWEKLPWHMLDFKKKFIQSNQITFYEIRKRNTKNVILPVLQQSPKFGKTKQSLSLA